MINNKIKIGATVVVMMATMIGGVGAADVNPKAVAEDIKTNVEYMEVDNANSLVCVSTADSIISLSVNNETAVVVGIAENTKPLNYNEITSNTEIIISNAVESEKPAEVEVQEIVALVDTVQAEIVEEQRIEAENLKIAEAKQKEIDEVIRKNKAVLSTSQGGLFEISKADPNYNTKVVNISGDDRWVLERLVMGEAGNQGFEGACLVAQALKDAYTMGTYSSISEIRQALGYSGSLKHEPNENVIAAVNYIFDQGGYAVKHRVMYFYAPGVCTSTWHESQNFIIQYKGHRVFDRNY